MPDLTPRQTEFVAFIRNFTARNGFAPTLREIGAAMGIASPNGVMCHIKALQRKGVITLREKLARSIQVLGDDDELTRLRRENAELRQRLGE